MTLEHAFATIIYGIVFIAFSVWYFRCWFLMLFRAPTIRSYFSNAYESSGGFTLVNLIATIVVAAYCLHWATN